MLRVPMMTLTTRHSPSLYPWQCAPPLPVPGVLIGLDRLGDAAPFRLDPWQLYAAGLINSPNMLVLGQVGTGKSALVKTYLHRQLRAGRRVAVLDPKGEYAPLAAVNRLQHLRLAPGGGDRLNPLDVPPHTTVDQATRHRAGLVGALAATGLGRDLAPEERAAVSAVCAALPPDAVLGVVVQRLLHPDRALATAMATTAAALASAVRPAALELQRLVTGDLAGMFDTASTVTLDPDGPGVVIDVSAVFGTDALAPVMTCVGAWLTRTITDHGHDDGRRLTAGNHPDDVPVDDAGPGRGGQRIVAVDEAWALLRHPATTRWLQSLAKLARSHGVQLALVTHRLSDLTAQADAGTASAAQALGVLSDCDIRVVHRQPSSEQATSTALLGLTGAEAELITRLPAHRALWRVGARHVAVVDHLLDPSEAPIVDTDAGMRS